MAGGSLYEMGSYPLLPIMKLLVTEYKDINIYSRLNENGVDVYTRGIVRYPGAVASFQLGLGVKTEGNLVISGTQGYVYVPSPWWKTDYFELRYEIQELVSCIVNHRGSSARLTPRQSSAMARVMEQFAKRENFFEI